MIKYSKTALYLVLGKTDRSPSSVGGGEKGVFTEDMPF